ncbi:ergosterol biosynthesis ERG4/ERG24 family-domain-containing protein [Aspergillus pseudonomiae]|uniref:7-dehydrocholesterol reductase n=1 Tax=Aspergillus pseudonomiae TaxID=1506151 RepID=A0A5N6IKG4_9EURO|nr:ergosterol biosynthesis ERG4/ERG24 family-domain-containing protein [Aspergillus pseudonomiae]KAB8266359.1 ergosterol biosynthesis ERG4/ERG24 family-domain-containing protein [Aspergillus pseudonomiae]KAE8404514.1 ergosterol biosynthesis ERG4/ERG24 family-domain-containing protein [Aspergillus pseudonomiae]
MLHNRAPSATRISGKPHIYLKADGKQQKPGNSFWGRRSHVSAFSGLLSLLFAIGTFLFVQFLRICLEHFDGSLRQGLFELLVYSSPIALFRRYLPDMSYGHMMAYASWIVSQGLLYSLLPGKTVYGPPTPGGNTLPYRMNGLLSWCITVGTVVLAACVGGVEVVASLAQNWAGLLAAANVYGLVLPALAVAKGHMWPSFKTDRRLSGSIFHDFLVGVELNPRLGRHWDLKMFQVGRLGMNSWVVIDLSFMAQQYLHYGTISNSILIVIILHAVYVIDFFINEDWYLTTIDIAHDHFGFTLAWGSAVWLPMVYTVQAQYLALHPVELSSFTFGAILATGILSYVLFRLANHQKHHFRQTKGNCQIAGSKPRAIRAQYTTAKGKVHETFLLYSGCWGIVRHPNYVGDIVFSFCTCVCCGWSHVLPYIYFIYMTILLVHRCHRDEKRCSAKYGSRWEEYQQMVRWRMIPGLF